MTARPRPKTRPPGDSTWRAVVAVHDRLTAVEHALAPALVPPMRQDMTGTRGPGAHPPEPVVMRQASSRTGNIWDHDVEHSPAFMEAIRNGTPLPDLRKLSADDAIMRARRDQGNPVMWIDRNGKPVMDGSVVQAPEQRSVTHHQWSDFADHQAPLPASNAEPAFVTARQTAAQLPGRQPETIVRGV